MESPIINEHSEHGAPLDQQNAAALLEYGRHSTERHQPSLTVA